MNDTTRDDRAKRSSMRQWRHMPFLYNDTKGFTLLFSVLIASLLLAVGLAIFDITLRELDLSVAARESQFAVYAADAGAECALFWETQDAFDADSSITSIDCLGNSNALTSVDLGAGIHESAFTISYAPERTYCATVVVRKNSNPPRSTTITSRGYNTCDASAARRVERAFEVSF